MPNPKWTLGADNIWRSPQRVNVPGSGIVSSSTTARLRTMFLTAVPDPLDSFILGTDRAGQGVSGLPAGWAPARTFTTAQYIPSGTVIEDAQFENSVDLRGTGITLRRCNIIGRNASMNRPMVYAIDSTCNNGPQNLIERCRIAPQYASNTNDSMMGFNYLSRRSEYTHGVDGSGSYIPPTIGTDLRVRHEGDWIHDLAYFCPDVNGQSSGQTHNDGNQHHSGTGEQWEGCLVQGFWASDFGVGATAPGVKDANGKWISGNANSLGVANGPLNCNATFEINQAAGGSADLFSFVNNWIEGGVTTFNLLDTKLSGVRVTMTGNRISKPLGGWNSVIASYSAATLNLTASGNTRADGTPLSLAVGDGRYNKT